MRKFKVTTSITKYYWGESKEDAARFQDELIQRGQLSIQDDGETRSAFCFHALEELIRVPEDFSQTRDPQEKLRPGDWLQVGGEGSDICAIVRRITRDRVHYLQTSSMAMMSVSGEQWKRWAKIYPLHARYERILPEVIVKRIIKEHGVRGLLSGMSAGGDSNLILDVLSEYGYLPNDWEMENGYWAEEAADRAIEEHMEREAGQRERAGPDAEPVPEDRSGPSFSTSIPTIDDFKW